MGVLLSRAEKHHGVSRLWQDDIEGSLSALTIAEKPSRGIGVASSFRRDSHGAVSRGEGADPNLRGNAATSFAKGECSGLTFEVGALPVPHTCIRVEPLLVGHPFTPDCKHHPGKKYRHERQRRKCFET